MRSFRVLAGVAVALAACTVSDRTGSSEGDHTVGELTWENSPYLWAAIDRAVLDGRPGQRVQPETHPVAMRLQAWIDRFDGVVRDIVHTKTNETLVAPKPTLRLHADADVNAWIAMDAACVAEIPSAQDAGAGLLRDITILTGRFSTFTTNLADCYDARNWPSKKGALDFFNGLDGYKVTVQPDAIVLRNGQSPERRVQRLAIRSATSFVNVNSALVAAFDEKSAAIVIAHELAHYYRAHETTSMEGRYDFWFDRDQHLPERPVPVENQGEYRATYEATRLPRFAAIDGLRHNGRLAPSFLAWARALSTAPGHVCEPFVTLPNSWDINLLMNLLDEQVPLTEDAMTAYRDFEGKAEACFDAITLGEPATTPRMPLAGNVLPRAFFMAENEPPFDDRTWKDDLSKATTLRELVEKMDAHARDLDAQAKAFHQRLAENRIGIYTFEQEADDIAMELGAKAGITPDEAIETFVKLMNVVAASANPKKFKEANGGLTAPECEALLAAGFEKDGKPVYVPLGPVDDPHHAYCYRIFNMWREKRAHEYKVAGANFPKPDPAWVDLQRLSQELSKTDMQGPARPRRDGGVDPAADASVADDDGTTSDEPTTGPPQYPFPEEPEPDTTTSTKRSNSDGGCSAAPSTNGSAGWLLALGVIIVRVRRRRI